MKETALQYAHMFWAWVVANPTWSMPIIGAIITLIFKPRSSLQYALMATKQPIWFWARVAALLQLIGAIFPDPVKARKVLMKFIYGDIDPIEPPKGPPGAIPMLLLAGALAFGTTSCTKEQVINTAVLFAEKAQCALLNSNLPNEQIIAKCAIEPGDIERILALVGTHREQAAKQAVAAAERERVLTEQRVKAGCGGYRDGGL